MEIHIVRGYFLAVLSFALIAGAQAAEVQIQLRGDNNPSNDYITWAPVPASIRVSDPTGLTGDLPIVLSDVGAKTDCRNTRHGAVMFSSNGLAEQATATLRLMLPRSGSPVSFFVAGKFGCPSTGAKDTAIVASTSDGFEVARHDLMIRVRKDAATLTPDERQIFLSALRAIKLRPSAEKYSFAFFVRTHRVAALGKDLARSDFYPDQAHNAPAFLAWHRAYLLAFERELQKIDPRVALPYWRIWNPQTDRPWTPFTSDFIGQNSDKPNGGETELELTDFRDDNPLFGWDMPYDNNGDPASSMRLYRFQTDWRSPAGFGIASPDQIKGLLAAPTFRDFAAEPFGGIELSPHDYGHNSTGAWMQNCKISPSDPVFWLFHTEHDHLWAEWQYLGDHFDNTGHSLSDYFLIENPDGSKLGYFDSTQAPCKSGIGWNCPPLGHNLFDTMWPWDGKTGYQPSDVRAQRRPPTAEFGLFPKSDVSELWPSAATKPRPADVVDYAGINGDGMDLGYGYDDVPFGAKSPKSPAVVSLLSRSSRGTSKLTKFELLEAKQSPTLLVELRRMVAKQNFARPSLSRRAMAALNVQMFAGSPLFQEHQDEVMMIAHIALIHPDHATRRSALNLLLSMKDESAVRAALDALANPSSTTFTRVEAIHALGGIGNFVYAAVIRPYLNSKEDAERLAAIEVLSGDPDSRAAREGILADRTASPALRNAALDSLVPNNPALPSLVRVLASDSTEPLVLRRRALAEINSYLLSNHDRISNDDLASLRNEVAALAGLGLPAEVVANVQAAIEAAMSQR